MRVNANDRLFLSLVHGPDIANNSPQMRSLFFQRLLADIAWIELNHKGVGHKQIVVLGDFNADPFDAVVGSILGLHAIRVRDVGGKSTRMVRGQPYAFFCNPMWSCFKGWGKSPPGTYYYNGGDVHEVFWHTLDQVVLRPSVLRWFTESTLRILTEAGNTSLLTARGLPDSRKASDHLPVLFQLSLTVE